MAGWGAGLARELGLPLVDKDDILSPCWWHSTSETTSSGLDSAAALMRFSRCYALPGVVVEVACRCPVEMAVARFTRRARHEGHGDDAKNSAALSRDFAAMALLAVSRRRASHHRSRHHGRRRCPRPRGRHSSSRDAVTCGGQRHERMAAERHERMGRADRGMSVWAARIAADECVHRGTSGDDTGPLVQSSRESEWFPCW
jgi:hypothetical protein